MQAGATRDQYNKHHHRLLIMEPTAQYHPNAPEACSSLAEFAITGESAPRHQNANADSESLDSHLPVFS
jgi:hypothetical protein